jgi:hypothetical protein
MVWNWELDVDMAAESSVSMNKYTNHFGMAALM